jgi:hypothetical protein
MSFADERQAVEARLSDNWTTTPIAYENVPFSEPSNGRYVAVHVLTGQGTQEDICPSPRHRYQGLIQIRITVPANEGTELAKSYADTISALFRSVSFSAGSSGTILCRTPSILSLGIQDGQFTLVISVPYQRDVIF